MRVPRKALKRWFLIPTGVALLLGLPDERVALAHGGLHQRIVEISAELQKHPDDARLYLQLAEVQCQHDEWEKALANLEKVEQFAPGQYRTDLLRSEAYLQGDRFESARDALDRFLASEPENVRALTLRARAMRGLKIPEAALLDYTRALDSSGRTPDPDLLLEVADYWMARNDSNGSRAVLTRGIELLGPIPSLVNRALEVSIKEGNFDAALQQIDAVQRSAPRPEPWMARRAEILALAGRIVEARAEWQKLSDRIASLPSAERGSHSMVRLNEQARTALKDLSTR